MKKLSLPLLVILLFSTILKSNAQTDDPINTNLAKAAWEDAFNNGKDFCSGVNIYNFYIAQKKGDGSFADYMPNAYSVYAGYSNIHYHSERVYFAFEFLLGKRWFNSGNDSQDTVNLFTASEYSDIYISVPLRYGWMKPIGKNSFLGFETGVYLLWGGLDNKIKNSAAKRGINVAPGDEEREMNMFDWGWSNKVTYGFRAFYAQAGFDVGLRNLAPNDDYFIKNMYNINLTIGYRFGSDIHKSDMNKINNLKNKYTGDDGKQENKTGNENNNGNGETKRDPQGGNSNKDKNEDQKDDQKQNNKKKNKRGGGIQKQGGGSKP